MKPEQIQQMALDAGAGFTEGKQYHAFSSAELERFAALVIAARDAELHEGIGHWTPFEMELINSKVAAAVLREREQCAKVCEGINPIGSANQQWMQERCAAAIRGQK